MAGGKTFLPGTGEPQAWPLGHSGTTKWWRGTCRVTLPRDVRKTRPCPSTILRMAPLPVPGRNLA